MTDKKLKKTTRKEEYQDPADDEKPPIEWGMIVAENMSYLMGALFAWDYQLIERDDY